MIRGALLTGVTYTGVASAFPTPIYWTDTSYSAWAMRRTQLMTGISVRNMTSASYTGRVQPLFAATDVNGTDHESRRLRVFPIAPAVVLCADPLTCNPRTSCLRVTR